MKQKKIFHPVNLLKSETLISQFVFSFLSELWKLDKTSHF